MTKGQLWARFFALPEGVGSRLLGANPLNEDRNRYGNVLPYDHWRVSLLDYSVGDNDYFNASPILIPGKQAKKKALHIATQGPTDNTFEAFWSMIIQQRVPCIVQATEFQDGPLHLCSVYLPLGEGERLELSALSIVCESLTGDAIETRTLRIEYGSKVHRLKHIHLRHWPDFQAPSGGQLHRLMTLVHDLGGQGPNVVHCSAGVGRAGTVLAAMALHNLALWQKSAPSLDELDLLIVQLRHQRWGMLQHPSQYIALVELSQVLWPEGVGA